MAKVEVRSPMHDLGNTNQDDGMVGAERIESFKRRMWDIENDPSEILVTIESHGFKVEDPDTRRALELSLALDDPDDEPIFLDRQDDFDIELAACGVIRGILDQEPGIEPPEPDAIMIHCLLESGVPRESIVTMGPEELSSQIIGMDRDSFIMDVHAHGFFKDPERVAYQISRSNTWLSWLSMSLDLFIRDVIEGSI